MVFIAIKLDCIDKNSLDWNLLDCAGSTCTLQYMYTSVHVHFLFSGVDFMMVVFRMIKVQKLNEKRSMIQNAS